MKCEAGQVQERLSAGKAIGKGEVQKGEVRKKVKCKKDCKQDRVLTRLPKHALGCLRHGADLSCLRQGSAPAPKDGGVRRSGSLVLSSGALLKVSQKQKKKQSEFQ